jgi:glycosyltransferase involved in cell wall biosynthesis
MPTGAVTLPNREMEARLKAFSNYEGIITNSELAKERILRLLKEFSAPTLPVSVIIPPVFDGALLTELTSKKQLILSVGSFRAGAAVGTHSMILSVFEEFCASASDPDWELICVGDIEDEEGLLHFRNLRDRATLSPVGFVVTPTREQMNDLLFKAKVFISATPLKSAAGDSDLTSPFSGTWIAESIKCGCVPLVPSGGVEAEICKMFDVGFTFDSRDNMELALSRAVALSADSDLAVRLRDRDGLLSAAEFYSRWDELMG